MRTQAQFQVWARKRIPEIIGILDMKGNQYTGIEESAFLNFELSSAQWRTDVPFQIMQAAQKHWTYLVRATQEATPMGFKLHNAPTDLIIYMLLLTYFMEEGDAPNLPSGSD